MMINTKGKNIFRAISLLVMAVFLAVTLGGCFPDRDSQARVRAAATQAAAKAEMAKLAKERNKPSTAEKLTELTKDLSEILTKADAGDAGALKKSKIKLVSLNKTINKEFRDTESKLSKINAKVALKRHARFVADYEKKMAKLNKGLATVAEAKGKKKRLAEAKKLSKYVATLLPKEKHQPLGSALPHRNVDYAAGPPTLGVNIAPAYMGESPGLEPSSLPRTPTEDDLKATVDTSQSGAIRKLANKLNKDPVKIYEFVRNNIIYEPYYGSRKGAQETLWEKGGNDVDQANLLIALYRYSNIPSRYVTGVVEIPIGQAMNWVGVEKEEVAAKVFSAAGIPSKAIVRGGHIDALQIEHTWAEAYVNYSSYRGVDTGSGEKMWVALDASYKRMEYKEPLDLQAAVSFDVLEFIDQIQASATVDPNLSSITSLDTSMMIERLKDYSNQALEYINTNMPNAKLSDVLGSQTIKKEKLGLLPASLPHKAVSIQAEWHFIPDSRQSKIEIAFGEVSYKTKTAFVAGKRVTLSYELAHEKDQQVVDQHGGLFATPAYLLDMKPVLKINGATVAEGIGIPMGSEQMITYTFAEGPAINIIDNAVTVGGYDALALDFGKISKQTIEGLDDQILANRETLRQGQNLALDDGIGHVLHALGQAYFAEVDIANRLIGGPKEIRVSRPIIGVGRVGLDIEIQTLFGIPINTKAGGIFLDIDQDNLFAYSPTGVKKDVVAFMAQSGIASSFFESSILEQFLRLPSISTVEVLKEANKVGVPVYTITSDNLADILPELTLDQGVIDDIQNAVSSNKWVIIPQSNLTMNKWQGIGYLVYDPESGSGGYIITGGYAGGIIKFGLACAGELWQLAALLNFADPATEALSFLGIYYDYMMNWEDMDPQYALVAIQLSLLGAVMGMVAVTLTIAVATGNIGVGAIAIAALVNIASIMLAFAANWVASGDPTLANLGAGILGLLDSCAEFVTKLYRAGEGYF